MHILFTYVYVIYGFLQGMNLLNIKLFPSQVKKN